MDLIIMYLLITHLIPVTIHSHQNLLENWTKMEMEQVALVEVEVVKEERHLTKWMMSRKRFIYR